MAQLNGRGPENKGARTGRGLGKCTTLQNEQELGIGKGMRRKSGQCNGTGKGRRLQSGIKQ